MPEVMRLLLDILSVIASVTLGVFVIIFILYDLGIKFLIDSSGGS